MSIHESDPGAVHDYQLSLAWMSSTSHGFMPVSSCYNIILHVPYRAQGFLSPRFSAWRFWQDILSNVQDLLQVIIAESLLTFRDEEMKLDLRRGSMIQKL